MRRTPSLFAAALLCLASSGASAQNATTRVTVTDTLIGEYHVDNRNGNDTDDDYGLALTRLNLTANAGDLSTSVRLDGFYYYDPPSDQYVNQAHLERISIGYRLGDFRVEAGDFYQQLGRGIVLSIRKVDEVCCEGSQGMETSVSVRPGRCRPNATPESSPNARGLHLLRDRRG